MKKKKLMPVENCCSPAIDRQRERQYQIEDGARVLQQASKIVSDKKLLKEIKSFTAQQVNDVNKIAK